MAAIRRVLSNGTTRGSSELAHSARGGRALPIGVRVRRARRARERGVVFSFAARASARRRDVDDARIWRVATDCTGLARHGGVLAVVASAAVLRADAVEARRALGATRAKLSVTGNVDDYLEGGTFLKEATGGDIVGGGSITNGRTRIL